MRRLFWFGAGIAAGVVLTRKVNETARKATPTGMAEQIGGAVRELAGAVGDFGAEVRAGMQEREQELQDVVDRAESPRPRRPRPAEADDTVRFARIEDGASSGRRARRASR